MSRKVTIELADDIYEALALVAQSTGRPIEQLVSEWMVRYGSQPRGTSDAPEPAKHRHQLHRYAGAVASGDPSIGDNDRIDSELADEYLNGDRNRD